MSDDIDDDSPDQDSMADDWAAAMEQQAEEEAQAAEADSVDFQEFDAPSGGGGHVEGNPDLDVILDIPVTISMEVGRTSITIRNLLQQLVQMWRKHVHPMCIILPKLVITEPKRLYFLPI